MENVKYYVFKQYYNNLYRVKDENVSWYNVNSREWINSLINKKDMIPELRWKEVPETVAILHILTGKPINGFE